MRSEPEIISSDDILRKYYESSIEDILPTFRKIEREYRNLNRRSEIYFNYKTRRKMVVRVFDSEGGSEKMCVTWLVVGETIYASDRS